MMPHILIYTDKLPEHSAGCANGPIIRIRPSKREDKGIMAHELVHVRQWWMTIGFHSLLYLLCTKYRQWAEVQAYRKQLEYPNARYTREELIDMYATWLSYPDNIQGYGLLISKEEAIILLNKS